jgi:LPXTG-motif cell wall-anchored protein
MKAYLPIFLLLALTLASASAYEYRKPVNIQCTLTPEVMLPGDEGLLAIEMDNGADAPESTGQNAAAGQNVGGVSNAAGTDLSTPINSTHLKGTADLKVMTSDYQSLGMIGPNDKITVYYKILASKNISSGTYLLDFSVQGGDDMVTINREIPIKVDAATVNMARADESATKMSFNLNVANPRENTLNAVTIVPYAKGIRFSPDEYYIGTMDPDEVFTISFTMTGENAASSIVGANNISFVAKFKNGDTWHQSLPYTAIYSPPKDNTEQSNYTLPLAGAALVIIIAAGYLYRRRVLFKRPKEN